jgi:uncharacterized protein involved in exopolysaccharide biosynthesis
MAEQKSIAGLLIRWRKLVYRVTGAAAIVAVAASLMLPNWYAATATALPPQESKAGGGLMSVFSRISMDFGIGGLVSSTPAADLMIGVLKSRLIRGQIVDRFGLVEVYDAESREHAIRDLADHVRADQTSEGLVEVWVEDRSPERAADMANAFMELLDGFHRKTSVEQARRTREFVETSLVESEARLQQAAEQLRRFQEEHGAIELTEQTRATVEAIARLQSERTELDIRRGVLQQYSTEDQTELRSIESRIAVIDSKLESLGQAGVAGGGVFLSVSEIPQLALHLAELTRDVMVQEQVYEFLTAQLEEARIQESRDLEVVSVLDRAAPPVKKHRPRRSIICILTVLLAFVGSVGVAAAAEFLNDEMRTGGFLSEMSGTTESRVVRRVVSWLRTWGGPPDNSAGSHSRDQ